jgi:hypothetical protein
MKIPHQVLVRLSPLVELASGRPLVEPFVDLVANDDSRLHLKSSYGEFIFDKPGRRVRKDGLDVASFDDVESVDISPFPGGRGDRSWSIVLFRGYIDRITVARTYDDGEASVLASKLAGILGCKVVSLSLRR